MDKNTTDETLAASAGQGTSAETQTTHHLVLRELSLMEKISFWVLLVSSFLLPVFVYDPFPGFSVDFVKKAVLFVGALVSLLFWLLARFEDGKISIPGGMFAKSAALLLASFVLSSFVSSAPDKNVYNSIFGSGFDTDTLSVFIAVLSLMFLSSIYFQSIKRLSYFYTGLLLSFLAVFLSEVVQLYMGGGLMTSAGFVSNLVGKWNDLGIFFGLCAVMSLAAVELLHLDLYPKIILWSVLSLSLVSVAVVNYSAIWLAIGITSLLIFVYVIFFNGNKPSGPYLKLDKLYHPSFAVILLCAVMSFNMGSYPSLSPEVRIGELLAKYNIVNLDVRPSLNATLDIARNTYKESWTSMFFGSGPNNFAGQWLKFKPVAVNETIFWNVDFNAGVGRIPSYFVTLGLFGAFAWLLFLGVILYYGFRTVLYSNIPKSTRFIVFISLSAAVYLWLFSFLFVPDTVIFAMTFLVTGVLIASLVRAGAIENFEFSFLRDPRLGFISVLILVVLVVACLSGAYSLYKRFASNYLFQNSLYSLNSSGDFDVALASVKRATEYDEQDLYYRIISEIDLSRLSKFISDNKATDKDSILVVRQMIQDASGAAKTAIKINGSNYLNWIALGRVGESVVPLGSVIEGSYDLASNSYKKALELNPKNPNILLNLARLEIANNDMKKAKEYLNSALGLKSNFTAAIYLLSQIEASEGNLVGAISKAEQASLFAPDDLGILFQLGFLKFSNGDFDGAIVALEKAESINPQYSNAKYFLGLSYAKVGKNSQAIKQFRDISALNPDNAEVKNIINNLLQGKDPFVAATSVKAETTKKGSLPVKEL